jgi:hypothetical protein
MLKGLDAEGSPDADALAEFIRKTLVDGERLKAAISVGQTDDVRN